MKKSIKLVLALALALAMCFTLVGCGGTSYTGAYAYNAWGTSYGFSVKVTMDGDKISSVERIDAGLVELSDARGDWTDAKRKVWLDAEAEFLKKFVGKTVAEVNAIVVEHVTGAPTAVSDANFLVAGATQSSGRVVLAVQNALSKMPKAA